MTDRPARVLVIGPQPTDDGLAYDYGELVRFEVKLHQPARKAQGALRKFRDVVEHRSGILWEDAIRGAASRPDLILALLEPYARVALTLKRLRIPPYRRTPVVVLSCWLAEDLRISSKSRRRQLLRQYGAADLILCLSTNQIGIFEECGFDTSKVAAIPYGVAPGTLPTPTDAERDIPLLSVGVDRGRDYATLVDAMRGIDTPIEVYAQRGRVERFQPPPSVRLHEPVPYVEYRALLRRTKIVVIPTFELAYPTGQSVALQAAMEGACVVVTRTPAMSEYFTPCEDAIMPSTRDPLALRNAIHLALSDESSRTRIASAGESRAYRYFNASTMWSAAWSVIAGRFTFAAGVRAVRPID